MNDDPFNWNDFMDDTNELSLAAVGAWLKCLHKMRKSVTRGRISMPIEGYARMFGSTTDQAGRVIKELADYRIGDYELDGQNITLTNRRMYREWQAMEANRIRQLRFQQEKRNDTDSENNGSKNNAGITIQPPIKEKEDLDPLDTSRKKTKKKVEEVFDFWREELNHPGARINPKRTRLINARLSEGYSVEELKNAVIGCKSSAYHMGKNDERKVYDSIELIFRDGGNVERFIGYMRSAKPQLVVSNDPEPVFNCADCRDTGEVVEVFEDSSGYRKVPCGKCAKQAVAA